MSEIEPSNLLTNKLHFLNKSRVWCEGPTSIICPTIYLNFETNEFHFFSCAWVYASTKGNPKLNHYLFLGLVVTAEAQQNVKLNGETGSVETFG